MILLELTLIGTNMTTKQLISFLMDLSDATNKARKEMAGIKASCRILSEDEHEAIKNLLLGIQSDAGLADSDLWEYQKLGFVSNKYAPVKK